MSEASKTQNHFFIKTKEHEKDILHDGCKTTATMSKDKPNGSKTNLSSAWKMSLTEDIFEKNCKQMFQCVDNEHGCLKLPLHNPEGKRLADWLGRQKKRTNCSLEEHHKFNHLWSFVDKETRQKRDEERWMSFFCDLENYENKFHTLTISKNDDANKKSSGWVNRQQKWKNKTNCLNIAGQC